MHNLRICSSVNLYHAVFTDQIHSDHVCLTVSTIASLSTVNILNENLESDIRKSVPVRGKYSGEYAVSRRGKSPQNDFI